MDRTEMIREYLTDVLENTDYEEIVGIYNYIVDNWYDGEYFHSMDCLNDELCNYSPTEIIEMVIGTDFDTRDDYFSFDEWNMELRSTSDPMEIDDVVELMVRYEYYDTIDMDEIEEKIRIQESKDKIKHLIITVFEDGISTELGIKAKVIDESPELVYARDTYIEALTAQLMVQEDE